MTDIPDDELMSAYLDGELSGEELARAEHMLATRPECRQLLEELTALRASLQGLPQHKLEAGFQNRVLRRAEREMLQPAAAARRSSHISDQPKVLSWQRWRRPLAWSAAAVAAGLLIMALSPDEQKVALAPAPPDGELHATPAAPALAERENENAPQAAVRPQVAAAPQPAPMASEKPTFGVARDEVDKKPVPGSEALADASDDQVIVVHCDVSTQAEAETALRGLLASNQIAWETSPNEATVSAGRQLKMATEEASDKDEQKVAPIENVAGEAVYVLADRTQLQTVIDTLKSSGKFRNVRLEHVDAPDVALEAENAAAQTPSNQDVSLSRQAPLVEALGRARTQMALKQPKQQGTAVQLPYEEVKTLLGTPNLMRSSDRAAGGQAVQQGETANAPAVPQQAAGEVSRQAVRMAAPKTRYSTTQRTPESLPDSPSQMSRALIILQVSPEGPADAQEPSPATP